MRPPRALPEKQDGERTRVFLITTEKEYRNEECVSQWSVPSENDAGDLGPIQHIGPEWNGGAVGYVRDHPLRFAFRPVWLDKRSVRNQRSDRISAIGHIRLIF